MSQRYGPLSRSFVVAWNRFQQNDSTSAFRQPPYGSGLEKVLAEILRQAREAWPAFELSDEVFLSYVAERVGDPEDLPAALGELHVVDLYLACACLQGLQAALVAFTSRYRPLFAAILRRFGLVDDSGQELIHVANERLVLPRDGRPAPLAMYAGRAELASYLRVTFTREGLQLLRQRARAPVAHDIGTLQLAAAQDDPELATLKSRYREQFKAAMHRALSTLDSAERNLLRYHYLEGMTTRQIGKLIGGSSSTVTRRLASVRAKVLVNTRSALICELDLRRSEFESLLRLLESHLDLSISRALRSTS